MWGYIHDAYGEDLGLTSDDDDYVSPMNLNGGGESENSSSGPYIQFAANKKKVGSRSYFYPSVLTFLGFLSNQSLIRLIIDAFTIARTPVKLAAFVVKLLLSNNKFSQVHLKFSDKTQ